MRHVCPRNESFIGLRMNEQVELLGRYLHLARASELRRRPHVRDRMLIAAAAIATCEGLPRIADACRRMVLDHNPNHAIRRWPTMADAMRASEFQSLLRMIQRRYPPEKAEEMLNALGIELGNERSAYYTDEEYAASLLGVTFEPPADPDAQ